jgi:bifunctional non-homologous end joining protein LigD
MTKVNLTNLDKILYPAAGIRKSQIIEYYIRIAPRMLGLLAGRLIVVQRFPDGVDGEGFYEKDAPKGTPPWVKTFTRYSESAQRELSYVLCDDLDTLIWLANLTSLEINVTLSRAESFERPDLVLFDLDPAPPALIDEVVAVALIVREKLDALGFRSFVKTSGKRGLHIVIPITDGYTFGQTREFVHTIGKHLAKESELVVSEVTQSGTPGKVHIDYMQNIAGKTMISPYSLRATQNATVSTPLEWGEIRKGLRPEEFDIFSVMKRKSSPWEGLPTARQRLEL